MTFASPASAPPLSPENLAELIVSRERAALVRWCQGDPSGFLEISAPDVVYFDPFLERRLDGWQALAAHYAPLRGTIFAERFELLNPVVQGGGDLAVLSFNFVSYDKNGETQRWNCTEAYRREGEDGRWMIIQTHWSFTHPNAPSSAPPA